MFDWIILFVLAILVGVAFFVTSPLLRISVVFILLLILIGRDLNIDPHYRSLIQHKHAEGLWTQQYKDGALDMLNYIRSTRTYLIVIPLLLLVLCARGFWGSKPDDKAKMEQKNRVLKNKQ